MASSRFPNPSGKFADLSYDELIERRDRLLALPDHDWRVTEDIEDLDAHLAALDLAESR